MFSLVYVSSAVTYLSTEELLDILKASRKNNQQLGITGMLLYRGGSFIQALEGDQSTVWALFEKIRSDNRHKHVTRLIAQPIDDRAFPDWSMGFLNVDQLTDVEQRGLTTYLDDPLTPESLSSQPSLAHQLLMTFKNTLKDTF